MQVSVGKRTESHDAYTLDVLLDMPSQKVSDKRFESDGGREGIDEDTE